MPGDQKIDWTPCSSTNDGALRDAVLVMHLVEREERGLFNPPQTSYAPARYSYRYYGRRSLRLELGYYTQHRSRSWRRALRRRERGAGVVDAVGDARPAPANDLDLAETVMARKLFRERAARELIPAASRQSATRSRQAAGLTPVQRQEHQDLLMGEGRA